MKLRFLPIALCAVLLLASDARAESKYRLKFATLAPDGTPWSAVLQDFKKRVEDGTNKEITIKTYLNGILGDERAMIEQMRFHKITGGGFTSSGISTVVPELQLLEIPFLFRDYEEIDYVMDQILWKDMQGLFEKQGLFLYSWAENGWHDFGFTKKKVSSWADFAGQKAFAQESEVSIAMIEALGGKAVPLAVPDVLSALQTGLIDAYSTTPVYGIAGQWFTQTKYWWDTGHIYQPAAVVFDLKFWNELPEQYRTLILGFKDDLQKKARADVRGIDEGILADFQKQKIEVIPCPPQEKAKMAKATEEVAKRLIAKGIFKQELYDRVKKTLSELRAKKK
ncbi:MAG: TRAP transporter substrate-binding protein DctP [Bdellovibrionota bacterium]